MSRTSERHKRSILLSWSSFIDLGYMYIIGAYNGVLMIRPYAECPSFERCSANVCPLDPLSGEKERLPGEDKCRAEKPTRLRIGSKYPDLLKETGLTKREFQARERQNALTPLQKELQLQACTKARKSLKSRLQMEKPNDNS